MPRKNETNEINLMKEAAKTSKSLTEISGKTGIDYKRIIYILGKHPVIKERISKSMSDFKGSTFAPKKKKVKAVKLPELTEGKYILIDASICGSKNVLPSIHKEIMDNSAKIILTDVTVSELEALEDGENNTAYVARRILSNSATHPDTYVLVKIPLISENNDDNIVNFASTVKNVTLFTSDKAMSLKARLNNIPVSFFFKRNQTLYGMYQKNEDCFIDAGENSNRFIIIKHNDELISENPHCLCEGDEIFSFQKTADDKDGLKLLTFKVILNGENKIETVITDRVFIKNKHIPFKYKQIFDLYLKNNS